MRRPQAARAAAGLLLLAMAGCQGLGADGPAPRAETEILARHGDWVAVRRPQSGRTVCLGMTTTRQTRFFRGETPLPKSARPVARGSVAFALSPHAEFGTMPVYLPGAALGPESEIALFAGPEEREFPLTRNRETEAYPADLAAFPEILRAIGAAPQFYVATRLDDGLTIFDMFSSAGATEAAAAARRACGL